MILHYTEIEDWFDYEDVFDSIITKLSSKYERPLKIVEIGAWLGKSSFYLVENHSPRGIIYIIDTWKGSKNELETNHKKVKQVNIYERFLKNMAIHDGKFIPIQNTSVNAAKLFDDNSIDFVYIDAEHTYDAVKQDIKNWMPKLTEFGIIAGHDYHQSWTEVIKAVNETIGIGNLII